MTGPKHPVEFHLDGQVAIVTGAAQGIGAACAARLVHDGAAVALWDVDDARGQSHARALESAGGQTFYCHCDVSSRQEVEAALKDTLQAFGRIDALVNNAGIFRAADFLAITESDWDAVIGVNLKGSFLVGQAVAKAMVAAGTRGAIVNMSSATAPSQSPASRATTRARAA